jgi:hypothetical protein
MTQVRELSPDQRVSFCPHCGNISLQRLLHRHYTSPKYREDDTLAESGEFHQFFLASCETCDTPLLYYLHSLNTLPDGSTSAFQQSTLEWPTPAELPSVVPDVVRACHAEAAQIKGTSPAAYAVLIRRALEALCDDQNAAKGPLATRLHDVAFRNEMPRVLVEMSDVLRLLGNVGAHNDKWKLSEHDVEVMDQFFKAIVEYLYIGPDRLRRYREALQALTKHSVDSEAEPADDDAQRPRIQ